MFVLLNERNIDIQSLRDIRIAQNSDGVKWDIIADRLADDQNPLQTFETRTDAESFITKAQDAISGMDNIESIDLRRSEL